MNCADANASYSVEDSIALGKLLEPFNMHQQPVAEEDLNGMAKVRQAIGIPVMAVNGSLITPVSLPSSADCADIVKLKVMKQGGFLKCRRMLKRQPAPD
jgi:muconate cycloisomerase